jgi:hypothetical protein
MRRSVLRESVLGGLSNVQIDHRSGLRIEQAKRLLETTSDPVDEISAAVGYEDASFYRRLFKRLTGLTPGEYRRMFQPINSQAGLANLDKRRSAQSAPGGRLLSLYIGSGMDGRVDESK